MKTWSVATPDHGKKEDLMMEDVPTTEVEYLIMKDVPTTEAKAVKQQLYKLLVEEFRYFE